MQENSCAHKLSPAQGEPLRFSGGTKATTKRVNCNYNNGHFYAALSLAKSKGQYTVPKKQKQKSPPPPPPHCVLMHAMHKIKRFPVLRTNGIIRPRYYSRRTKKRHSNKRRPFSQGKSTTLGRQPRHVKPIIIHTFLQLRC